MTSRRPHWDDDLIDAVRDAVDVEFDDIWKLSEDSIRAVIAAVEDWQEREKTRCKSDTAYHCATHDTQWLDDESDRCEYKRMVDAEAAVARVWELHRPCLDPHLHDGSHCCMECSDYGRQGAVRMYPCPTIRAIEGDAE
jgi:hypothetical protein